MKKFHQLSINYVLLKNVKCEATFTVEYLEPSQVEHLWWRFFAKIVINLSLSNIFAKMLPCRCVTGFPHRCFSGTLYAPCKMAPLNSFILQYLCHKQLFFCFVKWKQYTENHLTANFTRFTLIYKYHLLNTTS